MQRPELLLPKQATPTTHLPRHVQTRQPRTLPPSWTAIYGDTEPEMIRTRASHETAGTDQARGVGRLHGSEYRNRSFLWPDQENLVGNAQSICSHALAAGQGSDNFAETGQKRHLTGAAIRHCCEQWVAALPALAATTILSGNVAGWVRHGGDDRQRWPTRRPRRHRRAHGPEEQQATSRASPRPCPRLAAPPTAGISRAAAFAARYAPDAADVAAVQAMLTRAGMTNIVVGPHGAYVAATATVGQLRSHLRGHPEDVSFRQHADPRQPRGARDPRKPWPARSSIIEGLDDTNDAAPAVPPLGDPGRAARACDCPRRFHCRDHRRGHRRRHPAAGRLERSVALLQHLFRRQPTRR